MDDGAIVAAEEQMRLAKAAAIAKKPARDAAEKKLRREMSGIIGVLPCVIGKSDPRWLEFGLNQPRPNAPDARKAIARPRRLSLWKWTSERSSNRPRLPTRRREPR